MPLPVSWTQAHRGGLHSRTARSGHWSCNLCSASLALSPNAVVFLEQSGKWAFTSDPLPLRSRIWDVFRSDLFLSCSFTSFRYISKCHLLKDLSQRPNKTQHSAHSSLCCLFLHRTCNHHLVLCVSAHCSTPSLTGPACHYMPRAQRSTQHTAGLQKCFAMDGGGSVSQSGPWNRLRTR